MRLEQLVRVSSGTAVSLALRAGSLVARPTTAYLLSYHDASCMSNCSFCAQARTSRSSLAMLSRVEWSAYRVADVVRCLDKPVREGSIKRVCIQAINRPEIVEGILNIVGLIREVVDVPISVSCPPPREGQLDRLHSVGVERVGVSLDAATPQLFDAVKGSGVGGPYTWGQHIRALELAVEVFGKGNVITHLIVGLGESEFALVDLMQKLTTMGVFPSLFAFTPIPGTAMEKKAPPKVQRYRRMQLAHYLITRGYATSSAMSFNDDGELISFGIDHKTMHDLMRGGKPFLTSGCPNCNRPYYNERPDGPIYNYPYELSSDDIEAVCRQSGC